MQTYLVGGAVRDELLGFPLKDKDYVVVGSSAEAMLAAGYQAVGKDFPVFLHPVTHAEYALARTERKTGKGYKGFVVDAAPEVTLEEDLARRDLTINAMAKTDHGELIDPFNGLQDLQSKTLRHVSAAFAEDPVRILRTARFAARLKDFSVAPATNVLMQAMVAAGEVDALVAERVWQELAKGLMEAKPSRMFEVLRDCGALKKILPELDALWGVPQPAQYHPEIDTGVHIMLVIDYAASHHYSLAVRFAALLHDLGKGRTPKEMLPRHIGHEERSVVLVKEVCNRLRIPNECKALALLVAKFHGKLHQVQKMTPSALLRFLIDLDALRQPARFNDFLLACECDARGRTGFEDCALPGAALLTKILAIAKHVDVGVVARQFDTPVKIQQAVFDARLEAIQQFLTAS